MIELNDHQIERYARHILLKEVGGPGQAKLLQSRVLVIGAGGLGSPALLYLAAAGVGTLGVIDFDVVDLSNLQRQVLHQTDDVGKPKTQSAVENLKRLNPDVNVIPHQDRLTADNALSIFGGYDLIVDGSDTFETRFLVNDASFFAKKTLVSAAVGQFDAQMSTFKPHMRAAENAHPCYRCLFPEAPPPGTVPTCAEAGVVGALTGVMGSLQALEVVKELLDIGQSMSGRLLIFDALDQTFRTVRAKPDPKCHLCSAQPAILDLSGHKQFAATA
jgi:adenylyltransferase/sulfurtransferase